MSKLESVKTSNSESQKARALQISAWTLVALVSALAVLVWGHDYGWHFLPINNYQLFPLLGILAFSIMWTHYVMGFLREITSLPKQTLRTYSRYSGYAVLALILLHPGLLIYQRYRDGYGLPPHSYESYVAPGLAWVTLLGSASFVIFIAFEFHRFFGNRRWWHYVVDASDLAMLAIIYHGLRLGGQLQRGWFHAVWIFYGLSLLAILVRKYYLRAVSKKD